MKDSKQYIKTEEAQSTRDNVELSFVMPCYNEEAVLPISIPPLLKLFNGLNLSYEVILVNNGSWDSTPKVIDSFIDEGYRVRRVNVPVNQGYGWGIICGAKEARGEYIGYMGADGQIKPDDVIRIWQEMKRVKRGTIVKGQRINRADGISRRLLSWAFNTLFFIFFGTITKDVNGTPKFFFKDDFQILQPTWKDSFIDPELLIKAKALKFDIKEVPITFHRRDGGASTVRVFSKSIEFLKDMIEFRFSASLKKWMADAKKCNE